MNENFKTLLGQRIKEAQSALAEKADVSTNHISAIERGISDTKTEHFANIVKALGVSSDFLLFGTETKDENEQLDRAFRMASRVCEADKLFKYIIAGIELLEKK